MLRHDPKSRRLIHILFLTEINSKYQIEIINMKEMDARITYLKKFSPMILAPNHVQESFDTT